MVSFAANMAAAMPPQKIGINPAGCCYDSHTARTCRSSLSQLLLRQCFPSIAAAAPSQCGSYAYLLPKMALFSSLLADTFQPPATILPHWRRSTPKTDFFATISRNPVSKKFHLAILFSASWDGLVPTQALFVFTLHSFFCTFFAFTQHSVLSTSFSLS